MKYRIYIDEVGNSDIKSSGDENHRFLCLTGVIFNLEYVAKILQPELEALKIKYFHSICFINLLHPKYFYNSN